MIDRLPGLTFKKSNIRIWIHQKNLVNLQQVVWEGHGSQLLVEHSNTPKIKRFLEAVPHIMGLIKDIHTDVESGNLESLKTRVAGTVPPIVLSGKDVNGLSPLHKAAGLGQHDIAEYLIGQYASGINSKDNEGRTPLHYASLVKDGGNMTNFLIENGADESALDNKQKTAAYYKTRSSEIDSKLLHVIPECPRSAKESFAMNFDWSLLTANTPTDEIPKIVKKIKDLKRNSSNEEEHLNNVDHTNGNSDIVTNDKSETEEENNNNVEDVATDNHISEQNGATEDEKLEPSNNIKNKTAVDENVEAIDDDGKEEDVKAEDVDEEDMKEEDVKEEEDIKTEVTTEEPPESIEIKGEVSNEIIEQDAEAKDEVRNEAIEQEPEANEDEIGGNRISSRPSSNVSRTSRPNSKMIENTTTEQDPEKPIENHTEESNGNGEDKDHPDAEIESEGVIEGVVDGQNEIEILNEQGQDSEDTDDADVVALIEAGNMEQLAALVLNGDGEKLIGHESDNTELQAFLENVPVYMTKINKIHTAARTGSLRELQAALDRRKFAIAKDRISANNASPLHVAIIFGNTSIVRYLAGRFPETLQVTDDNGRTPLHYAATLADNGHYYNLLIHLGADTRIQDKFEHTPDFYRSNTEEMTHKSLLGDFGEAEDMAEELLNDKVPDDIYSARRDMDDEDMLAVLEKCYTVLHGRRQSISISATSTTTTCSSQSAYSNTGILSKHMRRFIFDLVRTRLTKLDHNLYDIIWPSVKKLPVDTSFRLALEQDFPLGLVAPDFYVYRVFKEFLDPIIKTANSIDQHFEIGEHPPTKFIVTTDEKNVEPIEIELDLDPPNKWIISDNQLAVSNNHVDMPFFATEEGRYLASSLGDPLIKGLTEVANKRPEDPIAYLATYLYNFANSRNLRPKTQENRQLVIGSPQRHDGNDAVPASIDVVTLEPNDSEADDDSAFNSTSRDEHGQSMLHFAAARAHGRNALFQLLLETEINVAYRDELYRTARDISIQANIPENTAEIDRYVLHIGAKGDTDKLVELLLDGYEHITDIVDEDNTPIIEAVSNENEPDTVSFLQSILAFEEKRERVHHVIRTGSINDLMELLADENDTGSGKLLALGKNSYGRCSLHIAVLCQQEEIVDYLANTFPDTLRLGDNLERTALHYAMGVEKIECISRVLIKAGAKRIVKDLKGRQPTYYFLNKLDISKLQEEEETF